LVANKTFDSKVGCGSFDSFWRDNTRGAYPELGCI
jgi:hypothetical protein